MRHDDEAYADGGSEDEATAHESSTGGPSDRQIRANRRNARKSTGPRTEAGKARSSQNARKHGIFTSKLEPVTDGSLAEDPHEFYERVELLVDSMHPRDPVEWEVATRIAGTLVKLERLDRWSASSIAGAAVMKPADFEAGARSGARIRLLERAAAAVHLYLSDPDLVADPDFETMATFVRYRGSNESVRIDGFWDDENTPSSNEEWRRVFYALKAALWSTDEKALSWAMNTHLELSRQSEQVENLEERIAANRILNGPFKIQLKYEAQLLGNLRILRKELEELQKRDIG